MDFSENARELEIERTEYLSLLKLFEKHANGDLSTLSAALGASDLAAVHQAAHSIKGASGNLNLWDIHEAADRICTLAHSGTAEPIDAQVSIIRRELNTLAESLSKEQGGE